MVAHSKEALVWYNYDVGRKCDPGEEARGLLEADGGCGWAGLWETVEI